MSDLRASEARHKGTRPSGVVDSSGRFCSDDSNFTPGARAERSRRNAARSRGETRVVREPPYVIARRSSESAGADNQLFEARTRRISRYGTEVRMTPERIFSAS